MTKIHIRRSELILKPDSSRVLLRSFSPTTEQRSMKIVARVAALSEEQVLVEFEQVLAHFEGRHRQLKAFLQHRFEQQRAMLLTDAPQSPESPASAGQKRESYETVPSLG